jgi:apolipoprotein N-acyltransferase
VPDGRFHGLHATASVQLLLALASGALLSAGYALHPMWWAPWLVPVLLLLAASGARVPSRAIGAIVGAFAVSSLFGYYLGMMRWASTLLIVALRAASWMLAVQLTNASARHLHPAGAMFVLPATVCASELLTLRFSPHGAAGSLAYSQMDMPGVIQVASVGGVCAVVFLVLLPGSFVGLCLSGRARRAGLRTAGALTALILVGTALFSAARIRAPQRAGTMPVTLIATNQYDRVGADWTGLWATYRPAVIAGATRGAS